MSAHGLEAIVNIQQKYMHIPQPLDLINKCRKMLFFTTQDFKIFVNYTVRQSYHLPELGLFLFNTLRQAELITSYKIQEHKQHPCVEIQRHTYKNIVRCKHDGEFREIQFSLLLKQQEKVTSYYVF